MAWLLRFGAWSAHGVQRSGTKYTNQNAFYSVSSYPYCTYLIFVPSILLAFQLINNGTLVADGFFGYNVA